jgi:threonine aldolase
VLCGSQEFIKKAHRARKLLGGGMRQAGVLAAAGIVALEKMVPRLGEDHARARTLAEGLSENRGLVLDAGTPATNMVFMNLAEDVSMSAAEVVEKMKSRSVLIGAAGARRFRLVTHCWIDDESVERTVAAFSDILI